MNRHLNDIWPFVMIPVKLVKMNEKVFVITNINLIGVLKTLHLESSFIACFNKRPILDISRSFNHTKSTINPKESI